MADDELTAQYADEVEYWREQAERAEARCSELESALGHARDPHANSVGEWRMFQNHIFWYGVFASAIAFVITVVAGGVTIN